MILRYDKNYIDHKTLQNSTLLYLFIYLLYAAQFYDVMFT